jgi:large subunit ribosomal protein L9
MRRCRILCHSCEGRNLGLPLFPYSSNLRDMKIILLRDIKNVGRKYQVKEVNDGFARNGLMAKGSALPATPENLGRLKAEMDAVAKGAEVRSDLLDKGLRGLGDLIITLSAKANPEGHLFAAIHPREIAKEVEKISGLKIDPAWIITKPLKTVGEHEIDLKIENKTAIFKVTITNAK